ncbi:hypothetical protein CTEN210_08476 [Chaetoceros tenuissimus]|uniref:Uncharacterized protein n=1 Tax=Chaetoceros tenuissimus TaxID=426638 RepID=A0AAD3CVZ0_9STRA|nr:hypothetical protein CTEN210_08476 [Chaetoceros tenuissimus]
MTIDENEDALKIEKKKAKKEKKSKKKKSKKTKKENNEDSDIPLPDEADGVANQTTVNDKQTEEKKSKKKKSKKEKKEKTIEKHEDDADEDNMDAEMKGMEEHNNEKEQESTGETEKEEVSEDVADDFDDENLYQDQANDDDRKVFVSRIPSTFTEESITSSFTKVFGEGSVEFVALTGAKPDENMEETVDRSRKDEESNKEHRGFAFVTMSSVAKKDEALEKETIRAKVKETSKRKHTLYIRPIIREEEGNENEEKGICFLWKKFRCPYGDECKFIHSGEGGCEEKKEPNRDKKSTQKCFSFRTKGKCKLGDKCPYSHDFEPKKTSDNVPERDPSKKDCINWKTKGKCRKGDKCKYRHDESVREAFLAKKEKKDKKRSRDEKVSQPLSVRVFGLNYDTTEEDVREYFKDCGTIKEITFPKFEDSGRSKGYCGVLFVSPKATEKAVELDGQELHGRWLSVQAGKMYLRKWEQREQERMNESTKEEERVGEFGQPVKKRKKHGYE